MGRLAAPVQIIRALMQQVLVVAGQVQDITVEMVVMGYMVEVGAELPVLGFPGSVVLAAKGAAYREERLVPLRFSVAHQSAAWFCFEIETDEDLVLVGFEYEYSDKGTRVVAGVQK